MADYAMSFDRLGLWIGERARSATLPHPQATSLSMLDGAIAAVVAGPISMMPEEWVCPLLGVDPDDFNHDTGTFSAIAATLTRHNAIVNTLSTKPESFEPLFVRTPNGEVDARAWCMGFYAVIKLRLLAWSRLMSPNATEHGLLLPILFTASTLPVARFSTPTGAVRMLRPSLTSRGATFRRSLKPCASSRCRARFARGK